MAGGRSELPVNRVPFSTAEGGLRERRGLEPQPGQEGLGEGRRLIPKGINSASPQNLWVGETPIRQLSLAFQRDSTPLEAVVCRTRNRGREMNPSLGEDSDLLSRLHLRFALNLPGRSEGEGGRGNPPVEPEPSPRTWFPPTDSAEEP